MTEEQVERIISAIDRLAAIAERTYPIPTIDVVVYNADEVLVRRAVEEAVAKAIRNCHNAKSGLAGRVVVYGKRA